jgi:hypothetical protein
VRRFQRYQTDRRYGNLWLAKVDGAVHRPLTMAGTHEDSPRWTADGKRLALFRIRAENAATLRAVRMDTSGFFTRSPAPADAARKPYLVSPTGAARVRRTGQ